MILKMLVTSYEFSRLTFITNQSHNNWNQF